jgi:hypothetical protein
MKTKDHFELGACGIVCSLCPRFHTAGVSRCTGCGKEGFREVHPACKIHSCACVKHGYETCADCKDFPCEKIRPWDGGDSFVTHLGCLDRLRNIQTNGYGPILKEIGERTKILTQWLKNLDDGRSKSYLCQCAALIELDTLSTIHHQSIEQHLDLLALRALLDKAAKHQNVALKLRKS